MVNKVSKSSVLISIFCVVFIGIVAVLANILWIESKRFSNDAISQQFDVLHQNFQSQIKHGILNARSIAIQESKSTLIVDALVEGNAKRYLTEHWSALFDAYPSLQQIRYIALMVMNNYGLKSHPEALFGETPKTCKTKLIDIILLKLLNHQKTITFRP